MLKEDNISQQQGLMITQGVRKTTLSAKRVNKTVMELAIGVIGIIGVMIAQLGATQRIDLPSHSSEGQTGIEQCVLVMTNSLKPIPPLAKQINWVDLLF
jgi:hypothetical protein